MVAPFGNIYSIIWVGFYYNTGKHSLPPPILKGPGGGGVIFDYLPWRGNSEKLKKGGGSMVQGQVLLKGVLSLFLFNFFKVYHFYI